MTGDQDSTNTARRRLSRRAFLRLALLGGMGASAAVLHHVMQPIGAVAYARWLARGAAIRLAEPAVVALTQCASYDAAVLDCLREAWNQAGMPEVAGKRVLVKPNLVDHIDPFPITTAPQVVGAVIDLLRERGAGAVVVGDGPGFRRDALPVAEASGLAGELARRHVEFVDLDYDDPRPVPVVDGWFPREASLWLPRHVREAELIVSVPKMKTHHWAGVSLSLKNLFGIVPGTRYGWPKNLLHFNGITASILGLYQLVRPMVSVVDGVIGMEGDGPLFGSAVPHGLLAVGRDPVAVDVICARLMGFSLRSIPHLATAAWTGIGQAARIETRGPADLLGRVYQRPPGWS
jgi:uncharacterized protein (DUF362 family)